jgi:transcriptional regulator with XRE-family HTH domain
LTELEDRWRDLGAFIREQRNRAEISLRTLSELAGVSNPYLSQIERGVRHPSAEILRQIAQGLEISAETLYVRAGILDEPVDGVDVIGAIWQDTHLDDDQKRTLVQIYRSFRGDERSDDRGAGAPGTAEPPAAEPEPSGAVDEPIAGDGGDERADDAADGRMDGPTDGPAGA